VTPTGRCPSCLEPVILARTEAHGRLFLLDPEPNPDGNQAVFEHPPGDWHTRQLGKDDRPYSFETVYMPHVATCSARKQEAPAAPVPLPKNVIPISRAPTSERGARPRPRGTR
jgi:hypothetical protein